MEPRPIPERTILVVDDDPVILNFVQDILNQAHYRLLIASSGKEALQRSDAYNGAIHLLPSDFQMPGMTGVDLATELILKRPAIKVLLMSGFTGGMLILNEGWHFLAKPFISSQLNALVVGMIYPEGIDSSRYMNDHTNG